MNSFVSEDAIVYKKLGQKLITMRAVYVDDTIHVANDKYSDLCKKWEKCLYARREIGMHFSVLERRLKQMTKSFQFTRKENL